MKDKSSNIRVAQWKPVATPPPNWFSNFLEQNGLFCRYKMFWHELFFIELSLRGKHIASIRVDFHHGFLKRARKPKRISISRHGKHKENLFHVLSSLCPPKLLVPCQISRAFCWQAGWLCRQVIGNSKGCCVVTSSKTLKFSISRHCFS